MYKKLCNAGFSVTSLDDLNVLLRDWLLIDRLGVQLWNIMRDIKARQEELERKWDEEVDAPKRAARKAKGTSQEESTLLLISRVGTSLQILDCQYRQICVLMPQVYNCLLPTPLLNHLSIHRLRYIGIDSRYSN
jgi:hypothetical protein